MTLMNTPMRLFGAPWIVTICKFTSTIWNAAFEASTIAKGPEQQQNRMCNDATVYRLGTMFWRAQRGKVDITAIRRSRCDLDVPDLEKGKEQKEEGKRWYETEDLKCG